MHRGPAPCIELCTVATASSATNPGAVQALAQLGCGLGVSCWGAGVAGSRSCARCWALFLRGTVTLWPDWTVGRPV